MGVSIAGDSRDFQHAEQISGEVGGNASDGVISGGGGCRRFHFLDANPFLSSWTAECRRPGAKSRLLQVVDSTDEFSTHLTNIGAWRGVPSRN